MTLEEARQIIKEHYYHLAYGGTADIEQLRQATAYLGSIAAEHMAWDSAIEMAKWLKAQDAQR